MTRDEYTALAEDIDTWSPEKTDIFIAELQNLMTPDEFRAFQAEIKRHDHEPSIDAFRRVHRARLMLNVIYVAFCGITAVIATTVLLHIVIK